MKTEQTTPATAAREDEDYVLVPRGLIGAACSAIDKKREAPNTLAELRRYTTGDLSSAAAVGYPPLPEPAATGLGDQYDAFDRNGRPMGKAYEELQYFNGNQMRAYVDADRASRACPPAALTGAAA